jgi:hypothetical protein
MGLSTSVLYELIVLANLTILAAASAAVVGTLRRWFTDWPSLWAKTFSIHVINLLVAMVVVPNIVRLFPTLWFAGLTVASILGFCVLLMIADGVRVWAKTQPNLVRPINGYLSSILFFAIFGLGILSAHISLLPGAEAAFAAVRAKGQLDPWASAD